MPERQQWFEAIESKGRTLRHVSKFMSSDFNLAPEFVESNWRKWNRDEKLQFAAAFSARPELNRNDQVILDYLMKSGDHEIWMTIALCVTKYHDRNCATNFLLTRIAEGVRPLANYYQALEILRPIQAVPQLKVALRRDRTEVTAHPTLQTWADRFIYMDYLSCSVALFVITGEERYRDNLRQMLDHNDEVIRRMARTVGGNHIK